MSKQGADKQSRARQAAIAAARYGGREDELVDAIISVAALVARADGWVRDVERAQLLDFLDRHGLLSAFGREESELKFERCVRELREPGGPSSIIRRLPTVIRRLRRHTENQTAALVLQVGDEVAAADCHLDPREERLLLLIRTVLEGEPRGIYDALIREPAPEKFRLLLDRLEEREALRNPIRDNVGAGADEAGAVWLERKI